jgi:hypothetical protein
MVTRLEPFLPISRLTLRLGLLDLIWMEQALKPFAYYAPECHNVPRGSHVSRRLDSLCQPA